MSATSPPLDHDWQAVDLSGDPHLVLGRRKGRGIEAARLDVHIDLFADMREACLSALQTIATTRGRAYEPNAQIETGEEHFLFSVADLASLIPQPSSETNAKVDDGLNELAESAESNVRDASPAAFYPALLGCLRDPGSLNLLTRSDFFRFTPLFYAIMWQQSDDKWVSFIRKTNPRQFFKAGRRWCQYSDALKRVPTEPTFVLEQQVDVVVNAGIIVSFSGSVIKTLFSDLRLVHAEVPSYVHAASETIREHVPLTEQSIESLNAAGKKLQSVATRLYGLSTRLNELKEHGTLTSDRYREIARDDERALGVLDSAGRFDFDEDGAMIFLDIIEGRYFEDDWTGSPRRADRFSQRST
jgi:hypothetical protein